MIYDVVKSVALATTGVVSTGHGTGGYFNQEKESFPCIWLFPVVTTGERGAGGAISSATKPLTHDILVSVVDLCDHGASTAQIEDVLTRTYPMAVEFFLRMCKTAGFAGVNKFRMDEIIHALDENTVGYALRFSLNVVEDTIYPCP